MKKRELISRAISDIRMDVVLREKFRTEDDMEMYSHMLTVIDAKIGQLLMLGLLTANQYSRLFNIIHP